MDPLYVDTRNMEVLQQKVWWNYLGDDLQKLLETSMFLMSTIKSWGADLPGGVKEFDDYAFVVFPAAKAYEGFLKKFFLDLKFITEEDYFGKHFRIGKSLNPSLPKEIRAQEVYGKVVKYCGGKDLADNLWETWSVCRNLTFHWFPNEKNSITFEEAIERVNMIVSTIDKAFAACKV
jgi:hypothetical protein